MSSYKKLIEELEELFHFRVEKDILEFPHNKQEFAPYVVVSLLKGVPHKDVPKDVLEQLKAAEELNLKMQAITSEEQEASKPKKTSRIMQWINLLKS